MIFTVPLEHESTISNHFYSLSISGSRKTKDFTFHAFYILDSLKRKQSLHKTSFDGFYQINKEILETIISKKYRLQIVRYLVSIGLIEVNHSYSTINHTSKGYRLTALANLSKWGQVTIKDRLLIYKLENWEKKLQSDTNKRIAKKGGGYQITNYWLNEIRISNDVFKELETVNNDVKKDAYLMQIERINKGKMFRVIDINNRFHHNLTNLKREFRKYLTIEGQPLKSIDINCSQPTFLAILLDRLSNKSNDAFTDELSKYKRVLKENDFYTYLNGSNFIDKAHRKQFKDQFFCVLFGKASNMETKTGKRFKHEFPLIFEAIKKLKARNGTNYIANSLQQIESEFTFNLITHIDTLTGSKSIPLVSLHDAIYTTENNIDTVEMLAYEYSHKVTSSLIKFEIE
jgi:hypothetical protein